MKVVVFLFFMTLVLVAVADYHDPNSYWDYDSSSIGDDYASAYASKYINTNDIDYYASGYASYSGNDWQSFTVSAEASSVSASLNGIFMGSNSWSESISTTLNYSTSVSGYGSCGYASASASE